MLEKILRQRPSRLAMWVPCDRLATRLRDNYNLAPAGRAGVRRDVRTSLQYPQMAM